MSITLYWIKNFACPLFRCDHCGQRIENPELAMAAWGQGVKDDKDEYTPVHIHKGQCLTEYEMLLPRGRTLMTIELSDHLELLAENVARQLKRLKERSP